MQTTQAEYVRVCYMRKHDVRSILAVSGLADDEVDDLDLSRADMKGFRYKGRCFACDRWGY